MKFCIFKFPSIFLCFSLFFLLMLWKLRKNVKKNRSTKMSFIFCVVETDSKWRRQRKRNNRDKDKGQTHNKKWYLMHHLLHYFEFCHHSLSHCVLSAVLCCADLLQATMQQRSRILWGEVSILLEKNKLEFRFCFPTFHIFQ